MASDSPVEAGNQASRLGAALDALEASLDALPQDADADQVARALAEPVAALAAAAKEALP